MARQRDRFVNNVNPVSCQDLFCVIWRFLWLFRVYISRNIAESLSTVNLRSSQCAFWIVRTVSSDNWMPSALLIHLIINLKRRFFLPSEFTANAALTKRVVASTLSMNWQVSLKMKEVVLPFCQHDKRYKYNGPERFGTLLSEFVKIQMK